MTRAVETPSAAPRLDMSIPSQNVVGSTDSNDPQVSIALADALRACREAMDHAGDDGLARELVRSRIRLACVLARQEGVPVEVLLVQLKRALNDTAAVQAWAPPSRADYQQSIVNFLVRTYFSEPR